MSSAVTDGAGAQPARGGRQGEARWREGRSDRNYTHLQTRWHALMCWGRRWARRWQRWRWHPRAATCERRHRLPAAPPPAAASPPCPRLSRTAVSARKREHTLARRGRFVRVTNGRTWRVRVHAAVQQTPHHVCAVRALQRQPQRRRRSRAKHRGHQRGCIVWVGALRHVVGKLRDLCVGQHGDPALAQPPHAARHRRAAIAAAAPAAAAACILHRRACSAHRVGQQVQGRRVGGQGSQRLCGQGLYAEIAGEAVCVQQVGGGLLLMPAVPRRGESVRRRHSAAPPPPPQSRTALVPNTQTRGRWRRRARARPAGARSWS